MDYREEEERSRLMQSEQERGGSRYQGKKSRGWDIERHRVGRRENILEKVVLAKSSSHSSASFSLNNHTITYPD